MKLRAVIAEHLLGQFRSRYLDLHCTTARERYDFFDKEKMKGDFLAYFKEKAEKI